MMSRLFNSLMVAGMVTVAGCTDVDVPPISEPAAQESPYDVYVRNAPAGRDILSAEDAYIRVMLYCDGLKQGWVSKDSPVDETLRKAYGFC